MAERKLEDLYPRAPRYTVELGDNQVVRFAFAPKGSKAMHTPIINVSESGMAFLVPMQSVPSLDEKIKVEFSGPNTDSMACFAKVVRIENHKIIHETQGLQRFKMVAVEFENLHPKQRELLSQGISQRIMNQQKAFLRQQRWLSFQWYLQQTFQRISAFLTKLFPFKKKNHEKSLSKTKDYIDL
jgi:hypothetical protein